MIRTVIRIAIISILMAFAVPVFAGSAVAIYGFDQADTAPEEDVIATAAAWLALAKTVKGGENLETRVVFPVAAAGAGIASGTVKIAFSTRPSRYYQLIIFMHGAMRI